MKPTKQESIKNIIHSLDTLKEQQNQKQTLKHLLQLGIRMQTMNKK